MSEWGEVERRNEILEWESGVVVTDTFAYDWGDDVIGCICIWEHQLYTL